MNYFTNRTILLISSESWSDHHVSKHHYAILLAQRGNQVYFLNPPASRRSQEKIQENLFAVNFEGHIPGIRWLPRFIQGYAIYRHYRKLECYLRVRFQIIWNFDTSRYFELFKVSPEVLKICHLVDLSQRFQRKELAATSDVCFYNSDPILPWIEHYGKSIHKIAHGVKYSPSNDDEDLMDLPGTATMKALYAGNLDIPYLDTELIKNLIVENHNVDFIFIGGYSDENFLSKLDLPNIHMLGKKRPDELQSYFAKADILLITYLADQFELQLANPHKVMEYLLSGKVTIATKTLEYVDNPHVEMAQSRQEFMNLFKKVSSKLDEYNSHERMTARKEFALSNTYEKQIERISEIVKKL